MQDAGPTKEQSRMKRAHVVMESLFKRVPMHQYRVSVVAVYSGAKAVVIDTKDIDVVRNILGDLPMHYAFNVGKTELIKGLEEAARIAKPWNPDSTTLIMVSDGDTIPATGMPKMPASRCRCSRRRGRRPPHRKIHRWSAISSGRLDAPPDRGAAQGDLSQRQREAPEFSPHRRHDPRT